MPPDALVIGVVLATFGLLSVPQLRVVPLSRAITAAVGAVLLVATGAIAPETALGSVDGETLLLLFGMLTHVEALAHSGFYPWAAARLVRATGTVRRLVVGTLWLAAVLSAVALNDAVVLLMTPVLVRAVDAAETNPTGPLLALVIGANVGSLTTPLGNPQNAYVLSQSDLTTLEFVRVLGPVAFVSLVVATAMLALRYDETPITSTVAVPTLDRRWALTSGGFLLSTFVLLAALPGVSAGVVAASMGVCHVGWLQVFRRVPGNEVLADLDWGILVLFVGLFVVVGAVRETALVGLLGGVGGPVDFAAVTFVGSTLVSNVPAVVVLSAAVTDPTGWYLLAAVSTLAGNATPIASAATLIVLDQASRRDVDLSVAAVVRVGFPIALVTSAVATAMLVP